MRRTFYVAASAALVLAAPAGCSGGGHASGGGGTRAQSAAAWRDDTAPAASAAKLGGAGTPCALPVTFDLARSWLAKPVPDGLGTQGGFALACEVDAKPAGHIGFLRVWAGGPATDTPAAALKRFLAADHDL